MNRKKAFIIYSGNNQRAVVSFCRVATRNEVPFFIIASGDEDSILKSEYKKRVFYTRTSRELKANELVDCCNSLRLEHNIDHFYVLPSSEYLNRFLLKNRRELEVEKISIPLVEESLYNKVSDKDSFTKLCEQYDLKVPKEISSPDSTDFPLVIKPRQYFSTNNKVQIRPIIVEDQERFNKASQEVDLSECFFQKYIQGESYYLLIYKSELGDDICFSQRNIVQQADGESIIAAETSSIHTDEIAQEYLSMLTEIGFKGLIMIELRTNDDGHYMIEANPRLWGPSQLFVDAGIPIFERFILETGFEIRAPENEYKEARYFWYGGLLQNKRLKKEPFYHSGSEDVFSEELDSWILMDIYNRKDTEEIYKLETLESAS